MSHYHVVTGTPVLNVRHYQNRSQRRLAKRVARVIENHGGNVLHAVTDSGTLKLFTEDQVVHAGSVKRDAQRAAKKTGGTFIKVDPTSNPLVV